MGAVHTHRRQTPSACTKEKQLLFMQVSAHAGLSPDNPSTHLVFIAQQVEGIERSPAAALLLSLALISLCC